MEDTAALEAQQVPAPKQKTDMNDPLVKRLLKVFWILLIVTIVEIALALFHFEVGFPPKPILNTIFIGLTIIKAFYIVAEFMHLKHELRNLALTILIPLIFLFWAIAALLYEGSATKTSRQDVKEIQATVPWEKVKHNPN